MKVKVKAVVSGTSRPMKDSGIEWIGLIPTTWRVIRHKYIMHKEKVICDQYKGEEIISLTMNGVVVRDLTAGGKMPSSFDGYQYVEPEDLLLCLFDIDVTPRCVGVVHDAGLTSPAYSRFKVHEGFYNAYYDYLLRTIDDSKVFVHVSKNLRNSLTESDFGALPSIAPPYKEQKQIADYLDIECARIDSVIEKTRESIEEYNKLKQVIITEAVTKGIHPNREKVDSGVEWIGTLATGYNICRLKYLLAKPLQYGANSSGCPYEEALPRFIRITDITHEGHLKHNNLLSLPKEDATGYILHDNELLFARSGATVGKAFLFKKEYGHAAFAGYLIRAVLNEELLPELLFYYTQSSVYENWKQQVFIQSTIQNIGADKYYELPVPIPPKNEQAKILDFIVEKAGMIDSIIRKKDALIHSLENYKKSMIFEYVTGKKEVK